MRTLRLVCKVTAYVFILAVVGLWVLLLLGMGQTIANVG